MRYQAALRPDIQYPRQPEENRFFHRVHGGADHIKTPVSAYSEAGKIDWNVQVKAQARVLLALRLFIEFLLVLLQSALDLLLDLLRGAFTLWVNRHVLFDTSDVEVTHENDAQHQNQKRNSAHQLAIIIGLCFRH